MTRLSIPKSALLYLTIATAPQMLLAENYGFDPDDYQYAAPPPTSRQCFIAPKDDNIGAEDVEVDCAIFDKIIEEEQGCFIATRDGSILVRRRISCSG